jgi:hypothetical protein
MSDLEPPNPEPPKPGPPRAHWTAVSIALFVLGLLFAIPSGLCTMLFGIPILFSTPNDFGMILVFGGPPFLIGAALIYAGLKSRRRD